MNDEWFVSPNIIAINITTLLRAYQFITRFISSTTVRPTLIRTIASWCSRRTYFVQFATFAAIWFLAVIIQAWTFTIITFTFYWLVAHWSTHITTALLGLPTLIPSCAKELSAIGCFAVVEGCIRWTGVCFSAISSLIHKVQCILTYSEIVRMYYFYFNM